MKRKRNLIIMILLLTFFNVKAQVSYEGHVLTNEGAWCWFADPRAIHYENESGTINSSYIGYIDVHGSVKAMQLDYLTGKKSEVLVRSYFQPDDHNNPTFLVLPDERILIIYSRHTDEAAFYYRVSTRPGDITTLGPEKCIRTNHNTTYPSPYILSDDPEHFYMCWRGINWHPTIAKYTLPDENGDVETAWGPYQIVQSTGARPYAKYYSNGKDKLYVTYTTGHPDNEQPNWVYFNVIDINATSNTSGEISSVPLLKDIKGTTLSTIANGPFKVEKTGNYQTKYPYTVVDAPTNYRDWVWQTVCDTDGNPIIAMVRINGGKSQHQYYYAKWTGTNWRLTDLADGGGRFHSSNTEYCYSGGEAIDPENPNVIYLSIPTNGKYGNIYEIWKYTLNESGTITNKEQITENSDKNNVRPYILPGSKENKLRLTWMQGDYYYWLVTKHYPKGYPTAIHCDYEWIENNDISENPVIKEKYEGREVTTTDVLTLPHIGDDTFTLNVNLSINNQAYSGILIQSEGFTYGLNGSTIQPYITINGSTYNSSCKLYSSDNWAINSNGTGGDNWPTLYGDFNVSLTYDGTMLTVYRNGLVDQKIECSELNWNDLSIGGFTGTINSVMAYNTCITQEQLKRLLYTEIMESISIPDTVTTDMIFPNKVCGENVIWTTDHPELVDSNGTVAAPEAATTVKVTVSMRDLQKTFEVTVMPRDISKNLLASYTFEREDIYTSEGITYVKEQSGNGYDLVLKGNATADGTLNLTKNIAGAFSSNGYAIVPSLLMKELRSYTIMFTTTPLSLDKAPRFYDFGMNSGNSLFLRANSLAAGIKYNGGTTTMVTGNLALKTNVTYDVAVTFDARTKQTSVYIDGALICSGTNNQNEPYMIDELGVCNRNYIGRTQWWDTNVANDNQDYAGTYDNFHIYNTALTEEEIHSAFGYRTEDPSLNEDFSHLIVNADFEDTYSVLSGSGVTSDRAIYKPKGWDITYSNRNENDMTILNSSCLYASLFSDIPTNLHEGKNAYLVRYKWGTATIELSQTCDTIPAGIYRIKANMWFKGSGGTASIIAKNENGSTSSGTVPSNSNEWQEGNAVFSCNGNEKITISLFFSHTENGAEMFAGFDNLILENITENQEDEEIHALLISMQNAADVLLGTTTHQGVAEILSNATEMVKGLNEDSGRAELTDGYHILREALRLAQNPDDFTHIGTIPTDSTNHNFYDLQGRCLGSTTPASAGLYIYRGHIILIP